MPHRILTADFFNRASPVVAQDLIGKFLVGGVGERQIAHLITEVEAYGGEHDMSSHARVGLTKRNQVMFGPPGHWYVYFIYGRHHCLNIVTEKEGTASAVLIRAVDGICGPGKIGRAYTINMSLYGKKAVPKNKLWIEDRGLRLRNGRLRIKKTPRVNVGGDETAKKKRWRFVLTKLTPR
ncbi:MAG: DNA-3-methyladenine glycosylase [Candidatus Sungbacteria bacterium]|uniref:Putative 3-methyladenine DNA glycosylase n=1 Tax=Candidatus Sungiibacteriota bacterium TaxID=2750080 RepID=A0A9D6QYC4_9BACT|nr:DNA-3-methyladenine glycosylase [Candidatus Sungbacteria bacterium]